MQFSNRKLLISYQDHELEWLKNLQLPLFIGQVRRKDLTLNLFPTFELNHAFILRDLKNINELVVKLQNKDKKISLNQSRCEISLGIPLLSFNMKQAIDKKFATRAYHVLSEYLSMEQQNVNSRKLRFFRFVKWETNKKVSISGRIVALRKDFVKDDLYDACESIVPGLEVIKVYANNHDPKLEKKLNSFVGHLRDFLTTPEILDENGSFIQWEDPF
ncbi:MAG: hypothetical protein WC952_06250 [Desulfobulbaceae bacterium]